MKVVLFCGGLGMRLRDYSEAIPKPMVPIGSRPVLWHVMKYYAHFGHKEFILCLGWQGNVIKDYFLHYDECVSNDFVLSNGDQVDLLNRDIQDWKITLVDTGMHANIGQRLRAVRQHLAGEEMFLANYSDGLTDLHLPALIDFARQRQSVATFLCVKPRQSFHLVDVSSDGLATDLTAIADSDLWINGGYFVLTQAIFDVMQPHEDLVAEPLHRLMARRQVSAFRYQGFWGCMDTYKEKQLLDDVLARGEAPWEVWRKPSAAHELNSPIPPESQRAAHSLPAAAGATLPRSEVRLPAHAHSPAVPDSAELHRAVLPLDAATTGDEGRTALDLARAKPR